MKETPIIFSTEMVRAYLEGRKTQSRRVIKPQPLGAGEFRLCEDDLWRIGIGGRYNTLRIDFSQKPWRCPYGQVGDRLWVKETWATDPLYDGFKPSELYPISNSIDLKLFYRTDVSGNGWFRWRSPLFMPRWASRIILEITGVRVERLQEITAKDIKSEGIFIKETKVGNWTFTSVITDFAILWDSLNAKRGYSWDFNPWVWVIEFPQHQSEKED
jgi:hypothetical protein